MRIFEHRIFIVSDDPLPMFKGGGLIFCLKHKMGSLVLYFFKGDFIVRARLYSKMIT